MHYAAEDAGEAAQNQEVDEPETDSKPHSLKYIRLPPCPNSIDPSVTSYRSDEQPTSVSEHNTLRASPSWSSTRGLQFSNRYSVGNWQKNSRIHLENRPNHRLTSILPVQHGESQGPAYRPVGRCRRPRPTVIVLRNLQPSHWQSPNIARFQERVLELTTRPGATLIKKAQTKTRTTRDAEIFSSQGRSPVQVGTDTRH
jgi:hypothetical protein